MASFIVLAAMKGRFLSDNGNTYDNFQMMGFLDASSPMEAVTAFFEQPPFPVMWEDVQYLWAERLSDEPDNARYGDYRRVYIDTLRRRYQEGASGAP